MRNMPSAEIARRKGDSICRNVRAVAFDCPVSCSIGLSVFSGPPDVAKVLEKADAALYSAKKLGKGRCVLWQPQDEAAQD